jgi:hypothetical protein
LDTFDIACQECGEEFEGDLDLAGEVVECPECGADIHVPDEEEILAAQEAPIERAPAKARRKSKAARKGDSKKSKKRSAHRRKSGGKTNLYIGLGAAAALLVVVVVVLALATGGDPTEESDEDEDGETSSKISSVSPSERRAQKNAYEKALEEAEASDDPSLWIEAGDLAKEAGLESEARTAWEKALEIKENYKPALRKLGYKQYRLGSEADEYEIEAGDAFEELHKLQGRWLEPGEFARARRREKEIVAAIKADLVRRANDPFYDSAKQVERVLGTRKGLNSRIFAKKSDAPYLVFEDQGPKGSAPTSDHEAQDLLKDKIRMLKSMYEYLMKKFFRPNGMKLDNKSPLVIISLKDREAFDKLHKEMGMQIPRSALAYFHRIHKYIILYNGAFDRGGGTFLENKTASDGVLWHEGTHQVVNAVLNAGRSGGINSTDTVYLPYWLNEGIAEYVGSLKMEDDPDEDGNDVYIPGSISRMRLVEFYRALHPEKFPMTKRMGITKPYAVDLERLLECHDHESTNRAIAKMYDDPTMGEKAATIFGTSMPYHQGTYFFYFCYNYENGKYAARWDKFLAKAFQGFYYAENFKNAFPGVDLKEMTREWFGFIEKLAREHLR